MDARSYCANYLRAWMLQSSLAEELSNRFGEGWYYGTGAGDLLKALRADGQKENAEGILALLNGKDGRTLSPRPLLDAVEGHLAE